MKKNVAPLLIMILALGVQYDSRAQTIGSDFHKVTVKVSTITAVQVSAGTLNMNITGASVVAGQDAMVLTDQTTSLLWGMNSSLRKVTVNTNLAAPKYTLQLLAVNPTVGTAASQVTLSTTAADFLLNLGKSSGNCLLKYTATALASQGTGSDVHTITFTIAVQ